MKVRSIDTIGDWNFGNGIGDYKLANSAIAQNIRTRLNSFLGDCFFDLNSGMDWYNLLGYKDTVSLRLAVSTCILNTTGVTGIKQLSFNFDRKTRDFSFTYKVQTVYSTLSDVYQFTQTV